MKDKYLEYLYLSQQMSFLTGSFRAIKAELEEKPKDFLLEIKLKSVQHDLNIIRPIYDLTQESILDSIEKNTASEFKWLKK